MPLAVVQSILDVKLQFSILVEDQCATSRNADLLIVRHVIRHGDVKVFLPLQFTGLHFENLHVLGDSFTKRKPVWSNTKTWSNRKHAAVCVFKKLERPTIVPNETKDFVRVSLQRFEVDTVIANGAFGAQPNAGVARSAC